MVIANLLNSNLNFKLANFRMPVIRGGNWWLDHTMCPRPDSYSSLVQSLITIYLFIFYPKRFSNVFFHSLFMFSINVASESDELDNSFILLY